jgi:uncharacterized membrane protein
VDFKNSSLALLIFLPFITFILTIFVFGQKRRMVTCVLLTIVSLLSFLGGGFFLYSSEWCILFWITTPIAVAIGLIGVISHKLNRNQKLADIAKDQELINSVLFFIPFVNSIYGTALISKDIFTARVHFIFLVANFFLTLFSLYLYKRK